MTEKAEKNTTIRKNTGRPKVLRELERSSGNRIAELMPLGIAGGSRIASGVGVHKRSRNSERPVDVCERLQSAAH